MKTFGKIQYSAFLGFMMIASFSAATTDNKTEGEQELVELSPFVVKANSFSLESKLESGSVTIISDSDIRGKGYPDMASVLQTLGGISISSFSGNEANGTVSMRGFGENSGLRALVLVDGVPLNPPDMGGISWLEIPLGQVEQVEILRGSQTARYGSAAVGGVINIITKIDQTGEAHLQVEGIAGSDNKRIARGSYGLPLKNGIVRLTAERNVTDGYRENGGYAIDSLSLSGGWTRPKQYSLRGRLYWSDERIEFPGPLTETRYRENPRQSIYEEFGLSDQYFSASEKVGVSLAGEYEVNLRFSTNGSLAVYDRSQKWNMGEGFHANNDLLSYVGDIRLELSYENGVTSIGMGGNSDNLDIQLFDDFERLTLRETAALARSAAFILWEGNYHLGSFLFESALRLESTRLKGNSLNSDGEVILSDERSDTGRAFQVGIRYQFAPGYQTWVRYDRLYRFPVTDEIASYQGFPLSEPFNATLEPEVGNNFEWGIAFESSEWKTGATVFLQQIEGEIGYDYIENLNRNFSDTERLGLEVNLTKQWNAFSAGVDFLWMSAEYKSGIYQGKAVYLVPEIKLQAFAEWQLLPTLSTTIRYSYTGSSFEGNDFMNTKSKLPGRSVVAVALFWKLNETFSLNFNIQNLFDRKYADLKYLGNWYPASGRVFSIGGTFNF